MYSNKLEDFLDSEGVSEGDTVEITTGTGVTRKGVVLPRSQQGDSNCIVLKLDSGYNIGIDFEKIDSLEKLSGPGEEGGKNVTPPERDGSKMDVLVLHTGGTIASRVSYEEGGVKPAFDVEDLLEMYPELFEMANIDSEVVAQMLSEDMEPEHWQKIAGTVFENLRDYDGIIVGHGTDTMQYTASALSFMLQNLDKPVVFVGAQRSSDRPSSDAAMNMECALRFIEEEVPGVYVCMHKESSDTVAAVHRGTRCRKLHTSRRDAFRTVGSKPFAEVDYETGEVVFNGEKQVSDVETELKESMNKDVGLIKIVPGMETETIGSMSEKDGVVIEGTGLGHMPVNSFDEHTEHHEKILDKLEEISESSLICMTSQCINGRVDMNVYDAGVKISKAGVVSGGSMLPGTAYVKLMWVLANSDSMEEAEKLFEENIAGEKLEREDADGFR